MSPVLVNPSRFGAVAPPASFAALAASLSPTGWWRLGESVGATTVVDNSGNGHNGTVSTGVVFGATGLIAGDANTAATFSSTNNMNVAYGSWLDASTALSLFAIGQTTSAAVQEIMDRDNGASPRVWQFRLNAGKLEFIKIGGGIVTATYAGATYNDGATHDWGATYDGSNIRLYADGVKVATVAAAGSLGTAAADLAIGRHVGSGFTWTGVLDEPMIAAGTVWTDANFAALHAARI